MHEKRRQLQLLAVLVAERNASKAGAKTIDGERRLPDHILLAKHVWMVDGEEDLN